MTLDAAGEGGMAMELSFPATPAHLADLRQTVRTGLQGEIPERDLEELLVALNEAATNAMLYGSGAGQPVEVVIHVHGGWAEVSVLDRGPYPRAGGNHREADLEAAAGHGGRGLWLMGRLVDEVRLERVDHGTRVTLRRRLSGD
jgi:anti-sigma regulatory factor (Ser/Thr protein kinase)